MQKKKKKENKKTIITIVVCVVIVLVVWLIASPLIKFNDNKNKLVEGAENYMERNSVMLPEEGSVRTIKLSTLYSQKYVDTLYSPIGGGLCSTDDSWVKVTKVNGEYNYYPYLKCGIFETKSVDHTGPVISLNGKEEITINVGDKYKDEGVKSVNDNEDGVMDTSKVEIKNNVKTSKAGTYKVTYKISDSLGNETIKNRIVHVIKKLAEVVKDDTDNTGVYKGNVDNNYIMFSGMMFRIVKVNDDDTIRLVTDNNISYVDYNNVEDWLNGYFYDHITDDSKKYMIKGKFCSDTVKSNPSKVTKCSKYKEANVGLITVDEFNNSYDKGTYLRNNAVSWTGTATSSKNAWISQMSNDFAKYSKSDSNAIRPVINLNKSTEVKSGNGTFDNPYRIGDYESSKIGDKINKAITGEYVSYGGYTWRIIEKTKSGTTKIIMKDVLADNGDILELDYEKHKNRIYNPKENGNVGYKINQKIGDYIRTTYFDDYTIDVPIYKNKASYNNEKESKKYKVRLAAPKMSEMFSGSNERSSYWFRDSSKNASRVYVTSNNDSVYNTIDYGFAYVGVKLVAELNKDVIISNGKGIITNPYTLKK